MTRRALATLLLLALFTAGGLVTGWIYTHPAAEAVPWNLTGMGGANSSLADQNVEPNVVRVHVELWPAGRLPSGEWLTQEVSETSSSVTITLRPMDAYRAEVAGHALIGMYDTGGWVNVQLREPLGGRTLIDGATGRIATEVVTLSP